MIYTDSLRAYLDGIELTFGRDTQHKQGGPFDVEVNTNLIERFHGTIKERTKVMRGLRRVDTARAFMDGWLVHYNYFRPHMSLKSKTPAEVAGINFPFRNWKGVCEQPYQKTARIPVLTPEQVTIIQEQILRRKLVKTPSKRHPRISPRKRISPSMVSLSQIRIKR